MTGLETLGSAGRSLLLRLGEEGVFAQRDAIDARRLSLFRARAGVTLGAGHARLADGEDLAGRGLAQWRAGRELRIAPAGRALLKRATGGEAAFAAQHREMAEVEDAAGRRSVNLAENPLLWLHRRKGRDGRPLVGAAAFAAGERLRADLTLAGALPRVTANWTAAVAQGPRAGGERLNPSEAALAARQRADRALSAVGGEFAGLLLDVCGFLKGLETVERERGWPPRSAKLLLAMALARLAGHYGLSDEACGAEGARRRVWRGEGARPGFPASP